MNKDKVKMMRKHLDTSFSEFEEKFGVKVSIGNMRYSSTNCEINMRVSDVNEDGSILTPEAESFTLNARMFGLKPEDLNSEFRMEGTLYQIVGLKTRASKYPILCLNKDNGKTYKLSTEQVVGRMALKN